MSEDGSEVPWGLLETDSPRQKRMAEQAINGVLEAFARLLAGQQQPLEPDDRRILQENYWDLITDSTDPSGGQDASCASEPNEKETP